MSLVNQSTTASEVKIGAAGTDYTLPTTITPTASNQFIVGDGAGGTSWQSGGVDTAVSNAYTRLQYFIQQSLTDGANIAWNLNTQQVARVTIFGNRTLDNPSNVQNGGIYTLEVTQGTGGNHTLSFGSNYRFPGGAASTFLSRVDGETDIFTFIGHNGLMYGMLGKKFRS